MKIEELLYYDNLSKFITSLSFKHEFLYWYVPNKLEDRATEISKEIKERIYSFKDGKNKDYELYQSIANLICNNFQGIDNLILACLPASKEETNEKRYRIFSQVICEMTGMINGFEKISIFKEKVEQHKLKNKPRKAEINYTIDPSFFVGKKVIIFDDVFTTGKSIKNFKAELEKSGALIEGVVTISKTCGDWLEDFYHPENKELVFKKINTE